MLEMDDAIAELVSEINTWLIKKGETASFSEILEKISELRSPALTVKETAAVFMAYATEYPDTMLELKPPYQNLSVIERLAHYAAANRRPDAEWKDLISSELETEPGKHDTAMETFIRKLHRKLPSLNIDWLFTGRGTMRFQDQFDAEYWRTRFYDLQTGRFEARIREEMHEEVEQLKQSQSFISGGSGLYIQKGSRMSDNDDGFDAGFGTDEEALF